MNPLTEKQKFGMISKLIGVSIFFPYLRGFLVFPLYGSLFTYSFSRLRLSIFDIGYGASVLLFFLFKLQSLPIIDCIQIMRVYFGFYFFYLYFKSLPSLRFINFDRLALYVSLAVILEAILINTVLDPRQLNVFPNFDSSTGRTALFGFYQRPYSIGSSPSVTGVLIAVLLSLSRLHYTTFKKSRLTELISFLATLSLASGTGVIAFFLYFIGSIKKKFILFLNVAFFLPFVFLVIYNTEQFSKLSLWYIEYLIDFKFNQIHEYLSDTLLKGNLTELFWVGAFRGGEGAYGGDFGWLDYFGSTGIVGLLLFIIFFISRVNSINKIPLFILIITSFHYSAITSVIGQILVGFCFALTGENTRKQEDNHV